MAVIKEWKCNDCGFFESDSPECPKCGNINVFRVFLSAPAVKSDSTKFTDANMGQLMKEFNMTDYSNNQHTKHEENCDHLWGNTKDFIANPSLGNGSASGLLKSIAPQGVEKIRNAVIEARATIK